MDIRKVVFLVTLIIPGALIVAISLYYFDTDYSSLVKAEKELAKLAESKETSDRQFQYFSHRAVAHRLNVFADGTSGLLGGIITAIGIHGFVGVKEDNNS
ncbi:MAG TPA: hypothetical protein VK184_17540 [Nostocaceae cyanobacterium]|nr:hypothetical protein [Nostocaceae cyanobacterium]